MRAAAVIEEGQRSHDDACAPWLPKFKGPGHDLVEAKKVDQLLLGLPEGSLAQAMKVYARHFAAIR